MESLSNAQGRHKVLHAHVLQHGQAAQAQWDGAAELIGAKVAESASR